MSPLLSLRSSSRRSASPRETRDFSFNDLTFSHAYDDHNSHQPAMDNYTPPSRPLTVAIPDHFKASGAYCLRRPNLHEILSNESPPPWTLSAFMAYLSHNHCLETLEFTMDAKRYRQHYEKASSKSGGQIIPGSEQSIHMASLWQRLMQAYILPNGPREVNLPSDVKDALLVLDTNLQAPHPDTLNIAIEKVHELMEESVLVPFLNSLAPQTAIPDSNSSSVEDLTMSNSYDERGLFRSRTSRKNRRRGSPLSGSPTLSASTPVTSASPPVMPPQGNHRASAPSAIAQFARNLSHSARHTLPIPHSNTQTAPRPLSSLGSPLSHHSPSSSVGASLSPSLDYVHHYQSGGTPPPLSTPHDDAVSTPSVSNEPMTPPTTPPTGDLGLSPVSAGGMAERTGNPWKRMRYSFGWRKRNDHGSDVDHL